MSNDIPYAAGVEYGYHPLSGMHPQAAIHCDEWLKPDLVGLRSLRLRTGLHDVTQLVWLNPEVLTTRTSIFQPILSLQKASKTVRRCEVQRPLSSDAMVGSTLAVDAEDGLFSGLQNGWQNFGVFSGDAANKKWRFLAGVDFVKCF